MDTQEPTATHALSGKYHWTETIGPVRLEPLPDGRYMIHIDHEGELPSIGTADLSTKLTGWKLSDAGSTDFKRPALPKPHVDLGLVTKLSIKHMRAKDRDASAESQPPASPQSDSPGPVQAT